MQFCLSFGHFNAACFGDAFALTHTAGVSQLCPGRASGKVLHPLAKA